MLSSKFNYKFNISLENLNYNISFTNPLYNIKFINFNFILYGEISLCNYKFSSIYCKFGTINWNLNYMDKFQIIITNIQISGKVCVL